jgi:hypothetical protein
MLPNLIAVWVELIRLRFRLNRSPFKTKRLSDTQLGHRMCTKCAEAVGFGIEIKSQFSPPPYAFGDQKDAPGWVWGFLDAT